MANTYCPKGHRVSYSATKPDKCPACGCDMAIKVPVATPAPTSTAGYGPAPTTYQPPCRVTVKAARVPRQSIRIEDLRNGGVAIERSDGRRSAPRGADGRELETVTAESIVTEMLKNAPQGGLD